jgi:hypothetical protein
MSTIFIWDKLPRPIVIAAPRYKLLMPPLLYNCRAQSNDPLNLVEQRFLCDIFVCWTWQYEYHTIWQMQWFQSMITWSKHLTLSTGVRTIALTTPASEPAMNSCFKLMNETRIGNVIQWIKYELTCSLHWFSRAFASFCRYYIRKTTKRMLG